MRLRSLDGVRGIAATLVFLHHCFECLESEIPSSLRNIFLSLGQQSVWLFFVLSGLSLATLTSRGGLNWRNFLLSRIVRLYFPTIAATCLTYLSILFISRENLTGNQWIDSHPKGLGVESFLNDVSLVNQTSGNLMPLWSLRWEVIFSLLLVGAVAFARQVNWVFAIGAGLLIGSLGFGEVAFYGSMFFLGVVIGVHMDAIRGFFAKRLFLANSAVMMGVIFMALGNRFLAFEKFLLSGNFGIFITLIGILLLLSSVENSWAGFTMRSAPLAFLGTISFSLYLIHEPLLIGVARITNLAPIGIYITMVLGFLAAYFFHLTIERRTHQLSRDVLHGRRFG